MEDEMGTMLWYRRIGRLCIEVHSDWEWGRLAKAWLGIRTTLNLGPLCLYWHPVEPQ